MFRKAFVVLALLAVILSTLPVWPIQARGAAYRQAGHAPNLPTPAPQWGGSWQYGPATPFQFARFDGGYFPGDGQVYFMGGRTDGQVFGNVWAFDPATGGYADTGESLVTPIQYYTMNLLEDAIGWGFYTFCGLLSDGMTLTPAVQVYYPEANLALQLGPEDDYPGSVNCMGAGNVVLDNKVYVFGGFDGLNLSNETWVFDPQAPAGSRWTQITTANLSTARAHIMGATIDGKIYAIGGGYISGPSWIALPLVEVLDPAEPTPIWDDAAVADLPEPCIQGRAWDFDSGSPYSDPDGTPMGGKIVSTCAGTSPPTNHVYAYDSALNTWEAFPSLNTARRLSAAELVGGTGPHENGIPGLWVWGGTDPAGGYLNTAEFYTLNVTLPACSVLLIDDDLDFTSTHGGGRPYYTSTLDILGQPYDLWDTAGQGTPPSATLSTYDVVIWFTGYDQQTPISPTEEAALIEYLDQGGNLFVSDQEQHAAYGMTPLLSDYFWVQSIVDDVTITDTVGNIADPLFAGLGPYSMARPDLWDTYWPTDTQEVGPYDDEVHVKPGGFEPMNYFSGGAPNSTRFASGNFKALYLAWPFEWLPGLDERAAVLGTVLDWFCNPGPPPGIVLLPPAQAGSGISGAAVPYTLTLFNNMGTADSFTITYNALWPISGPGVIGPVDNGASQSFAVTVTIPASTNCFDSDMAEVHAQAQVLPVFSDSAYLQTTVVANGTGTVAGVARDANTGLPIQNAFVDIYLGAWDFYTWTLPDGSFRFSEIPACSQYDGTANYVGYYNEPFTFSVEWDMTTTLDLDLDAGRPALSAAAITYSLAPSDTATTPLTLTNTGSGDLRFYVSELASGTIFEPPLTQVPLPRGVDQAVYQDLAASPDGSGKFIAYMAQQADLSAAWGIRDWAARGQYVLDTLRSTAQRTQASMLVELDRAGLTYRSYYIVNAVVVEGDRGLVDRLAGRPDVAFIGPNTAIPSPAPVSTEHTPTGGEAIEWNIQKVRADEAWSSFGATGQGMVVSSIDTGVLYTHTALINQYRGNLGGGSFDHNYSWWNPYHEGPPYPNDTSSHGSHTMGTMVGSDNPSDPWSAEHGIGVAPGARWIACDGFEDASGYGYNAQLLECAEFLLAPWDLSGANPRPDMRPDVVNNSWGGGQAQWWYNQVVYAWRAAGIFPAFANGNDGPNCDTVGDPADLVNTFAVGATDSADSNAPGTWAEFSSRGPAVISGLVKPNVSAPGAGINSAYNNGGYGPMDGTSMASPHVAGEVVLIWSAIPELRGDVQLTSWLIEQSALPLYVNQGYFCGGDGPPTLPNNQYGWGRIDAYQAISLALSSAWDILWLDVDPVSGTVAPSASLPLQLTFDSSGLAPDTCYTGTLKTEFNDPYVGEVLLPVQMCIVVCQPLSDVNFTWSPPTITVGQAVTLSASSAGGTPPISYIWELGDGASASGAVVTHVYAVSGTYTVTLTAVNDCSNMTRSHTLTVQPAQGPTWSIYLPIVTKGHSD